MGALLLWLLSLHGPLAAQTQAALSPTSDHILQRAYWEDRTGEASFEQARQQAYTVIRGTFSQGYSDSVHWVRLRIAASATPLGLRMQPPWIDEIMLYDPVEPNLVRTVGDRHPGLSSAFAGLGHSVLLPGSAQPREVWLRIRSTSSQWLDAEAIAADAVPLANARALVVASTYVAGLLLMWAVLAFIWWLQRDALVGAYLLRHLVFSYYVAAFLGLPAPLLSPTVSPVVLDWAFTLSIFALLPLGLRFDAKLLAGYRAHPLLLHLVRGCSWLGLGLALLAAAGMTRLALQINAVIMLAIGPLLLLAAWSCNPTPETERLMPRRFVRGGYLLFAAFLLTGLAATMGWLQANSWTIQLLVLPGLVTGVFMTTLLLIRSLRLARQNEEMAWQLRHAQQSVESEQRQRQEQSQFLHMLMHELKTPLSVITLALGVRQNLQRNREIATNAVRYMKAIIDRCVEVDRLEAGRVQLYCEPVDLSKLLGRAAQDTPDTAERLHLQTPPGLCLHTDAQYLHIVLFNLLDNATRYGDPLTPVLVSAQAVHQDGLDGVLIAIANTPGMAGWPDPQQLFTKHYRATGAQRASGSGLGLYLCKQLTVHLGGQLRYAPTEHLIRFELWLPLR